MKISDLINNRAFKIYFYNGTNSIINNIVCSDLHSYALNKLNNNDIVEYCKNQILNKSCNIYKKGKNWYCEIDNIIITINSYSYTIITAHTKT